MTIKNPNPTEYIRLIVLYLAVTLSLAAGTGCNSRVYDKRYFILDVTRPKKAVPASRSGGAVLEVRRFTIDRAFDSKSLVYRKNEFEYEPDFYNEFLISPAEMITEKTRNWLSNSGLFIKGISSSVTPAHTLEGNITALYGDYTDRSSPRAVMELRIFLIDNTSEENRIAFAGTYNASVDVDSEGPEGLIKAFNSGLEQILPQLEDDLAGKIPRSDD